MTDMIDKSMHRDEDCLEQMLKLRSENVVLKYRIDLLRDELDDLRERLQKYEPKIEDDLEGLARREGQ